MSKSALVLIAKPANCERLKAIPWLEPSLSCLAALASISQAKADHFGAKAIAGLGVHRANSNPNFMSVATTELELDRAHTSNVRPYPYM